MVSVTMENNSVILHGITMRLVILNTQVFWNQIIVFFFNSDKIPSGSCMYNKTFFSKLALTYMCQGQAIKMEGPCFTVNTIQEFGLLLYKICSYKSFCK